MNALAALYRSRRRLRELDYDWPAPRAAANRVHWLTESLGARARYATRSRRVRHFDRIIPYSWSKGNPATESCERNVCRIFRSFSNRLQSTQRAGCRRWTSSPDLLDIVRVISNAIWRCLSARELLQVRWVNYTWETKVSERDTHERESQRWRLIVDSCIAMRR